MIDYANMDAKDFRDFCVRNLVPLTFETCNGCDKVFHPHDGKPGRCLCGHWKQTTQRRFPRSMLVTYLNAMQGIYQWK